MCDAAILSQKLRSNESIMLVLDVYRSGEIKNNDFLLVIVSSGSTYGVFVFKLAKYPALGLSDLTIDFVFPVDQNFVCEIDSGEGISMYQIRLAYKAQSERFFYSPDADRLKLIETFRTTIEQVKSQPLATNVSNFAWLDNYSKNREDFVVIDRNVAMGVEPVQTRDQKFKEEIHKRREEYTTIQKLKVFCGTWNVNCIIPFNVMLKEWLSVVNDPPDIYAIAFQEIDMKADTIIFSESRPDRAWNEKIHESLHYGATYEELATVRFVGMQLSIFIRSEWRQNVKICKTDMVGTGTLKYGNKGGVGVSLKINESLICFVNSHLAAHQSEVERRNEDFNEIVRRMQFTHGISKYSIHEHDLIFWLGDLNYRVDCEVRNSDSLSYKVLGYHDQLYKQKLEQRVFQGYEEGEIAFQPTYKYDTGTDNFDSSEKMRAPAWCDRILWRGRGVIQTAYNSIMEIRFSDHKPVYATFLVPIRTIDAEKYNRIHEEVLKLVDKHENDNQPMISIAETDIDFGEVKFNEPQVREIIITNNCHLPANFEFKCKNGPNTAICEPWVHLSHKTGRLFTGDILNVQIKVNLDTKGASEMMRKLKDAKSGEKHPLDILVLHVERGRDTFITLFGEYKPSSYGLSMETLVKLSKPVTDYSLEDLIAMEMKRTPHDFETTMSNRMIPREVWLLVDYLHRNGLQTRELFTVNRKYAKNVNINEIRDWLDSWSTAAFPGTPHTTAEALLMLFESTPELLLCLSEGEISAACDDFAKCKKLIVDRVSSLRRRVFLYVCLFIRELRRHSDVNQMNDRNLALIFSRVFIRPNVTMPVNPAARAAIQAHQTAQEDRRRRFIQRFFENDVQQWAETELSSAF